MKHILALFLSTLSEPLFIFLLIAFVPQFGLSPSQLLTYRVVIFVFMFLVCVARFYLAKKLKTNWDISDRKKRVTSLGYLLGIVLLLFAVILQFHNSLLTHFYIFIMCWFFGFALISLKLKISGHVGVLVLLCNLVGFWPLYVTIPLVAWSRLELKRHTMFEIIGGLVYSQLLYETWIRFFR